MKTCPLDKISTEKSPFSMVVDRWSKLDTDGQSIASQSAGAGQSLDGGRISKVGPKVCLWLPLVGDHEQEGGRGSLPPFEKNDLIN